MELRERLSLLGGAAPEVEGSYNVGDLRVVLITAMKKYGIMLANNGSDWSS
jgi:hypothetical protein